MFKDKYTHLLKNLAPADIRPNKGRIFLSTISCKEPPKQK